MDAYPLMLLSEVACERAASEVSDLSLLSSPEAQAPISAPSTSAHTVSARAMVPIATRRRRFATSSVAHADEKDDDCVLVPKTEPEAPARKRRRKSTMPQRWDADGRTASLRRVSYAVERKFGFVIGNTLYVGSTRVRFPCTLASMEGMVRVQTVSATYYHKSAVVPKDCLRFLRDRDQLFCPASTFVITLVHGDFFHSAPLFSNSAQGLQAIICLNSTGVSTLGVTHSRLVERVMRPGEFVVTTTAHHLYLPPVCSGSATYLVVQLLPECMPERFYLTHSAFDPTMSVEASAAWSRWRRCAAHIDTAIAIRHKLALLYFKFVMTSEMRNVYTALFKDRLVGSHMLAELSGDIALLRTQVQRVGDAAMDIHDGALTSRIRCASALAVQHIEQLAVKYANTTCATLVSELSDTAQSDLCAISARFTALSTELRQMLRAAAVLAPGMSDQISTFVAESASAGTASRYAANFAARLTALNNISDISSSTLTDAIELASVSAPLFKPPHTPGKGTYEGNGEPSQ